MTSLQDVSMRLIAARVIDMPNDEVYLQGERALRRPVLPGLSQGKKFHVYCSAHNWGAKDLILELK